MAPSKPVVDFNAIVQADRRRRKNQIVAQRIFDRARKQNAQNRGANHRESGTFPSLASRVDQFGISKRNYSSPAQARRRVSETTTANAKIGWTHDNDLPNNNSVGVSGNTPPRGPKTMRTNSEKRVFNTHASTSSPHLNSKFNIVGNAKPAGDMSIRGIAGPYTVIVKNLAVGTTAADIESAMTPVGGIVLSCRLIVERPKVIAELILETKEGADSIVETFNNQSADGNILHVYHKAGTISHSEKLPPAPPRKPATPVGPRADLITERSEDSRSYGGSEFGKSRGRSRDRYRDYEREDIVDGSYGFNDPMEIDDHRDERRVRGLYSDNIISNKYGRGSRRGVYQRYK